MKVPAIPEGAKVPLATGLLLLSFGLFSYHTIPVLTLPHEVKYGEAVLVEQVRRIACN